MPEMDGWQTLQELRGLGRFNGIRVIMLTTASAALLEQENRRYRTDVFTKPFDYTGLYKCWQAVLALSQVPRAI